MGSFRICSEKAAIIRETNLMNCHFTVKIVESNAYDHNSVIHFKFSALMNEIKQRQVALQHSDNATLEEAMDYSVGYFRSCMTKAFS